MQILALDTASPAPSVTLLARGAVWEEPLTMTPQQSRRASEELLPAIDRCFAAAGTRLADCDRIAVCSGPGSFTGLRIGLATAWALGRAAGVSVETVSTLEALAETARYQETSGGQASKGPAPPSLFTSRGRAPRASTRRSSHVAAVLDAGRGEVVLAVYSLEDDRATAVESPARLSIDDAKATAARFPTVALPPDLLFPGAPGGRDIAISPSCALALAVARRPGIALERLEGIYSRPSAAEEKRGAS
jgi:tRNA threonylcarbamoyl adenosine modification protein YeaZ